MAWELMGHGCRVFTIALLWDLTLLKKTELYFSTGMNRSGSKIQLSQTQAWSSVWNIEGATHYTANSNIKLAF